MGWSVAQQFGLTYHRPQLSVKGYTLVTPLYGDSSYLVDMDGSFVHRWQFEEMQAWHSRLMPNGNLLAMGLERSLAPPPPERDEGPPPFEVRIRRLGGSASVIREVTWEGDVVWEHREPAIHHDFLPLPNGNFVFPVSVEVPEEVDRTVRGGFRAPREPRLPLIADDLVEVDRSGNEVSRIHLWQLFDPRRDPICPLEHRHEWTHVNSIDVNADGDIVISCRNNSRVAIIDGDTHEMSWRYGAPDLAHQHHATWVTGNRIQIFDNGMHRKGGMAISRIVEVDPATSEETWAYEGTPREQFFSGHISGAHRLSRENVLICEGTSGRLLEVTRSGEPAWEWWNPIYNMLPRRGNVGWLFRAYRYEPDFPGFRNRELDPERLANLNRMYGLG
jgi:hypothetical protein